MSNVHVARPEDSWVGLRKVFRPFYFGVYLCLSSVSEILYKSCHANREWTEPPRNLLRLCCCGTYCQSSVGGRDVKGKVSGTVQCAAEAVCDSGRKLPPAYISWKMGRSGAWSFNLMIISSMPRGILTCARGKRHRCRRIVDFVLYWCRFPKSFLRQHGCHHVHFYCGPASVLSHTGHPHAILLGLAFVLAFPPKTHRNYAIIVAQLLYYRWGQKSKKLAVFHPRAPFFLIHTSQLSHSLMKLYFRLR